MNDITLLLNTCDSHSEAWAPFFTLLKNNWPSLDYPIAINTETKQFNMDNLNIQTINTPSSISWSDRLLKVLDAIKTPFVLVFLEDFFLESPPDLVHYNRCVEYIKSNKNVGCISFRNTPDGIVESENLPNYALLNSKAAFRANCQIGLWRTNVLKKILRKHENAWEFEVWASKRSGRLSYEFYSILPNIAQPFDYDWGKPIYRGHWNMESVNRIEAKTGVKIPTNTLKQIPNMNAISLKNRKRTLKTYLHRIKSFF